MHLFSTQNDEIIFFCLDTIQFLWYFKFENTVYEIHCTHKDKYQWLPDAGKIPDTSCRSFSVYWDIEIRAGKVEDT